MSNNDSNVTLSTAEMWDISTVGALLMMAVQNLDNHEPSKGREKVVEAANILFSVVNQLDERDGEWPFRGDTPPLRKLNIPI